MSLVRTRSASDVRDACVVLAAEIGRRFHVGEAVHGRTPVYAEDSAQDSVAARALSQRLAGRVVHLVLLDEDVAGYSFLADGELVEDWMHSAGYYDGGTT